MRKEKQTYHHHTPAPLTSHFNFCLFRFCNVLEKEKNITTLLSPLSLLDKVKVVHVQILIGNTWFYEQVSFQISWLCDYVVVEGWGVVFVCDLFYRVFSCVWALIIGQRQLSVTTCDRVLNLPAHSERGAAASMWKCRPHTSRLIDRLKVSLSV